MAKKEEENHKLLSDEPVLETGRSDNLGFGPAAEVLARAAVHTESPMTIGVFGNWGTGKTSLMRLMHECVDQAEKKGSRDKRAVPIWFNAYKIFRVPSRGCEESEHALNSFLVTSITTEGHIEMKSLP